MRALCQGLNAGFKAFQESGGAQEGKGSKSFYTGNICMSIQCYVSSPHSLVYIFTDTVWACEKIIHIFGNS